MRDRYELGARLGAGAHGAVYRGRDTQSGRVVAVKIMGAAAPDAREHVSRVSTLPPMRPAWMGRAHPNIAEIYDAGGTGDAAYRVMELAPGIDLRCYTEPGHRLPLATTLSIIARVADALDHVHQHGVVHGDVNPANIIFDAGRDSVKVTDFPMNVASPPAAAGVHGTFAYMSPEQVCGLPIGAASDQFSLGATLYRLACGRLPFFAGSRPRLALMIVNEPHVDMRIHDATLPAALAGIIDRMLQKNPERRYARVRDAAGAIGQISG